MIASFLATYIAIHFFFVACATADPVHLTISLTALCYRVIIIPQKSYMENNKDNKNGGAE